jgi:hypothetical protein
VDWFAFIEWIVEHKQEGIGTAPYRLLITKTIGAATKSDLFNATPISHAGWSKDDEAQAQSDAIRR